MLYYVRRFRENLAITSCLLPFHSIRAGFHIIFIASNMELSQYSVSIFVVFFRMQDCYGIPLALLNLLKRSYSAAMPDYSGRFNTLEVVHRAFM